MNTLEIEVQGGTVVVPVDDISVVEVETKPGFIIVPFDHQPQTIEIVAEGPQGPPGPPGPSGNSTIGGYEIDIQDVAIGDVLAFAGSNWTNRRQVQLTDGGNF